MTQISNERMLSEVVLDLLWTLQTSRGQCNDVMT